MIKKLDTLIIKAFIGPFVATFFITLFVLVLQFYWLYIDDLVGKGLDLLTIGQLTGYVAAYNVPLALPLAILLSSIMTFGNLGETFELIAIKSAGIPLTRFMRPLFITTLFLCGAAFLFNNNIIPIATLKMNTLKYDIIMAKPAFDIKEGVFYDKIDGFVIKIGKKEKDDKTIRNIIIYEKNYGLQDNIIVANSGEMKVTPDKRFLEFNLMDGWRYEEQGSRYTTETDYIRMGFKEYKKLFDLSSFQLNKTNDSVFRENYKMLSVRQLGKRIDSLEKRVVSFEQKFRKEVEAPLYFLHDLDTGWAPVKKVSEIESVGPVFPAPPQPDSAIAKTPEKPDTLSGRPDGNSVAANPALPDSAIAKSENHPDTLKGVTGTPTIFADSLQYTFAAERVLGNINMLKSTIDMNANDYDTRRKELRFNLIEWHKKFAMSFACMVLFLIGAPLGSIIRKGGLGMPLVIAVIFFVVFFLLNNFGEKLVKEDILRPVGGMWAATFILLPVGIFLTIKAMKDSQLFYKELYLRLIRRFRKKKTNTYTYEQE